MMPLNMYVYRWVNSWLTMIDGVVGVVTLGLWMPVLSFKHCIWFSKREMEKKINQEEN